ncbi:hypothetical protein [Rhizobium leguminosarum]|nr:hypothetical protein [Rhizobium leguminosarum]
MEHQRGCEVFAAMLFVDYQRVAGVEARFVAISIHGGHVAARIE